MKKRKLIVLSVVAFFVIFAALPQTANSQQYWMNQHEGNSIGLEIVKPIFDSDVDNVGFLTTCWLLSGQHLASDKVTIVYQLPIANYSVKDETIYDESETSFGNPYIGIRFSNSKNEFEKNKFITHIGIRLPFASDNKIDAARVGYFANHEQLEAFLPEYMTFSFAGTFRSKPAEQSVLNISIGGNYMLSTDDRDSEFLLDYNVDFTSTSANNLILGAGFTGKMILSQSGLSFSERTVHQLALLGGYNGPKLKPILTFKIPFDDNLSNAISFVLGFKFIYKLN